MASYLALAWDCVVASSRLFAEVAPFLLGGLLLSGLIAGAIRRERVERLLGGSGFRPILTAAVLGIPIPLCSCGVVPAAMSLRRHGASRGATISFLVSTPETGVDSIAISYALLGPVFALARPVAAFVSAITAGWATGRGAETAPVATPAPPCDAPASPAQGTRRGLVHALDEILGEIGPWLLAGVLLAGILATSLPDDALERLPGGNLGAMLVLLVVSAPLYICASASTPIAAALLDKGLSPGAALVFLLVGPATNIATVLIVIREFGARVAAVYLTSLAITSVAFGLALDALWGPSHAASGIRAPGEMLPAAVSLTCALLLLFLIARQALRARPAAGVS